MKGYQPVTALGCAGPSAPGWVGAGTGFALKQTLLPETVGSAEESPGGYHLADLNA